jgi:cysteine sulfinate desulfinase/cysteine desulfurase-like protein
MTSCKSTSEDARSYVVDALGNDCGKSSLRFTFGKFTTKKDIDFAIKALSDII